MKAYSIADHVSRKGNFKLVLNEEVYDKISEKKPINSSYNILAARLLGLDYADFLQYIVQDYGAVLHGRESKYIFFSFNNKEKLEKLVDELNSRWNRLLTLKN